MSRSKAETMEHVEREKDIVELMIRHYCRRKEGNAVLCSECSALLDYARRRLEQCRYGNCKPTCRKCLTHCYKPEMKEKIRRVMRWAGPRMVYSHPIAAFRYMMWKSGGSSAESKRKTIKDMNKREYAQANKDWLAAKATEEGVRPLAKGVYYKVLAEGKNDGRHPSPRSIVTAHYTGWTINGKKFDSSRGGAPLAVRLSDLVEGWIVAMQQMCAGDKWEVYLPAEMGYGKFSQPGIPGGSTLVFEIELLSIA